MNILALDPGGTTGVCVFSWPHSRQIKPREDLSQYLIFTTQINSNHLPKISEELSNIIVKYSPEYLIFEHFGLYGHKAQSLIGSDMLTSQVIGIIKIVAYNFNIECIEQMAANVKLFYTDSKLKNHNVYLKATKHARDAVRHALYAVDFKLCKGGR